MNEIDELKKQIQELQSKLEDRASNFSAEGVISGIEEKLNVSRDDASELMGSMEEEIKKSPFKSLAIALGVGFIAAKILK